MSDVAITMIGVGRMAAKHAAVIEAVPGLRLASCASRSRDRAEAFAAEHGVPRPRLVDEVLAKPESDALWVVAPAGVMGDLAVELDALGLPLFLEKPVGLGPEETARARAAVTVPHMVGLNRRHYEVLREGRRLIEAAGGLRTIEIHMPENPSGLPDGYDQRVKQNWHYANSIHLIDLFRVFAGEVAEVTTFNTGLSPAERSYFSHLRFADGAAGMFNAQWYAPGGWRVTLYATDLSIVFQPIETGRVLRRNADPENLLPSGPDRDFKPGLYGQAEAFRELVRTATLPAVCADLADYERSVALVAAVTRLDRQQSGMGLSHGQVIAMKDAL